METLAVFFYYIQKMDTIAQTSYSLIQASEVALQ